MNIYFVKQLKKLLILILLNSQIHKITSNSVSLLKLLFIQQANKTLFTNIKNITLSTKF